MGHYKIKGKDTDFQVKLGKDMDLPKELNTKAFYEGVKSLLSDYNALDSKKKSDKAKQVKLGDDECVLLETWCDKLRTDHDPKKTLKEDKNRNFVKVIHAELVKQFKHHENDTDAKTADAFAKKVFQHVESHQEGQ